MAIKVNNITVIDDSRNATVQNLTVVGTTNLSSTSTAFNGSLTVRGGDSGQEGGQLILGYANGVANTISGQANNTWNLDVDSLNNFRVFRQDSVGQTPQFFYLARNQSSGADHRSVEVNDTITSDVTSQSIGFLSLKSTQATAFTLPVLDHFQAYQGTKGAGSNITTQTGFKAHSTLVGGNTNIGFASEIPSGTNRWNFYAGGTAHNYFSGNVMLGHATIVPYESQGLTYSSPKMQIAGADGNGSSILVAQYNTGSTVAIPTLTLAKSKNATVGSHTAVASGDSTGAISFDGSDGTRFAESARILAAVDGAVSANVVPGRLIFATSSANTPLERMRLDSAGNVNIGTFTTSISSRLTVVGQANFTEQSNNTRLRVGYGTVPGVGGTASYIVNADNSPVYGGANNTATGGLMVSQNNNVIIGSATDSGSYKLQVVGAFAATTKSFLIDHPTKSGMKLRYASLEGPENGVYIRGRNKTGYIILPDYWAGLVDPDTITVDITPIGRHQNIYVSSIQSDAVFLGNESDGPIDCFYTIYGERKDVEKLVVEFDGE